MDIHMALGVGLLAGFGLAAPLGAIGILLIREGMAWGFKDASPAAAAVATVDTIYCIVAVALGVAAAPLVSSWGAWPGLMGGLILVLIGAIGVSKAFGSAQVPVNEPEPQRRGRAGRFMLFTGLTAINPTTLLYFVALLTAVARPLGSFSSSVAFVTGVGAASLVWQLGLVFVGRMFRARAAAKARRRLNTIGFSLVVVLGLAAILQRL
ncbi:LysE family transporter [Arthrobacter alpinus]|nr:LysE family transporter [Arthrobacter alpinus]